MRIHRCIVAAAMLLPLTAGAQRPDTIHLGDRVRIRVPSTRGAVNLFVGNVAAVTRDTLILDIPGGKGTITLPRASVTEVALTDGHESRWTNVARSGPMIPLLAAAVALPVPRGPHSQGLRNQKYVLVGVQSLLLGSILTRSTPERWRPLYSWLDRP